ncbi:hypothetical protein [uncultured Clostridium sp.]|jgi:hypothetical protein|uniref:hypothetical protein n=1 Tax=uncultured Clostridium sp. TaxID=59620 RepID=UPI0025DC287A|nr:hypothetical protein [uncultured Clostridium sp.]
MINLLKVISIICIVIALIIGVPSFIKIIKMQKELKKMNPNDMTPEPIRKESLKIVITMLIASSLLIISIILNFIIKLFLI